MNKLLVVGSGPSAVHFAQSALERGRAVTMLDVGREAPEPVEPDKSFVRLKEDLADPAEYFLGRDHEAVIYPGAAGEYYGFPPSKSYVFEGVDGYESSSSGFDPLFSFARGGLAEAWTAGVFPYNTGELEDFPFGYGDLAPYYEKVAERIGVHGLGDDLAKYYPVHAHMMGPLELDEHARILVEQYEKRRGELNRAGIHLGRSRAATISVDHHGRKACSYLGRCLWGCPTRSLYTPSITLEELMRHERFEYVPGRLVTHFRYNEEGRVSTVMTRDLESGEIREVSVDTLVLAAGTLASSRIFLESVYRKTGEVRTLTGLMDNRQLLVPFVNLRMLGKTFDPESYQYHQLLLGFEGRVPKEFVHCQITTLKTALIHPIVQSVPLDLRTSLFVFRNVHAALGIVNVNLHDTRRPENHVTLDTSDNPSQPKLRVHYEPAPGEKNRTDFAVGRVKKALFKLGCVAPPGMTHVRPMGASVHYAGTLPMSRTENTGMVSPSGRSNEFSNLVLADGATFPFLPAKNLTFTLMANAARIAHALS